MRSTRALWLGSLALVYEALAAAGATQWAERKAVAVALALLAPLALALAHRHSRPPSEEAPLDLSRAAFRLTVLGALAYAVARVPPASPGFVAVANAGVALAGIASTLALARFPSLGGLAASVAPPAGVEAAALASLPWAVAITLPAVTALGVVDARAISPTAVATATTAASLASLALTGVLVARLVALRRHELGVAGRARAALGFVVAASASAVALASFDLARPEEAAPGALALSSVGVASTAISADPLELERAVERVLGVAVAVLPLGLLAAWLMDRAPSRAAVIAIVSVGAASAIGVGADSLVVRLQRGGTSLGRFGASLRRAGGTDAFEAVRESLLALGTPGGRAGAAVWVVQPAERWWVDRAGFPRREPAATPPRWVELAAAEPERVLRASVLRAAVVRRPEVRDVLAHLEEAQVETVALLGDESDPVGLLALPPSARLELAEVRALRALCDRLAVLVESEARVERALAREAREREQAARSLEQERAAEARRVRTAARARHLLELVAGTARDTCFSADAKLAAQALTDTIEQGGAVTVLPGLGHRAMGWVAASHLASSRRDEPFVRVDGRSLHHASLDSWRAVETSPLAEARGGTLVVDDPASLPREVQRWLAHADRASASVAFVSHATLGALAAQGAIDPALADVFGDRVVALPPLEDRGEDLRPLATAHLAAAARALGLPAVRLEPRALDALLEHPPLGGEIELEGWLVHAAAHASRRGEALVRLGDLPPRGAG